MRNILRAFLDLIVACMPKSRFGDYLVAIISFFRVHKRLPNQRSGLMNDVLFYIKTSVEIDTPLRGFTSDKEYIKLFIKSVAGEEFNVNTIAVLRSPEEVNEFNFPARCCIKPTHMSGHFIIRKQNEDIPLSEIKNWFKMNHYESGRERNYKYLEPKVIVEPLVFDSENVDDYKFFCSGGSAKMVQVDFDRKTNHTRKFFDREWNDLNFTIIYPRSDRSVERPECYSEMVIVCEKLAAYFRFVRIDLYTNGSQFFVGEITHCPDSARGIFIPRESERLASSILFAKN